MDYELIIKLFIYSVTIEMAHQYILVVKYSVLVAKNEMFSRMNVKILIQRLHKTKFSDKYIPRQILICYPTIEGLKFF